MGNTGTPSPPAGHSVYANLPHRYSYFVHQSAKMRRQGERRQACHESENADAVKYSRRDTRTR